MKKRILIIAAHPDDDILGCGGTLSKMKKNNLIKVLFIGEGTSCRFANLKINKKLIKKEIEIRERNAKQALKSLGIKHYEFTNFPCGRLDTVPIIEINKKIENQVSSFRPNIIYTHSENDCNNDHRIVFRSTMMATRPTSKHTVDEIFSFEILSSSEWNFTKEFSPNYFEILNKKNIEAKWKALSFYKSETQKYPLPRSKQGIYNLAKVRGSQAGVEFAEAFKLIRSFKK
ncbi:MAG: GlcNAc-PI de-N-acetylase [Candidatus Marinimicrobia bacterium]|nr:GlcNAc-PI de-N-acetylase [Candidatus Neomarinimicrobiota bacterium]|tara:strand:+ start:11651 stop:12340 length:690 start_codon:yes stop_codon:yes gene_type:complete